MGQCCSSCGSDSVKTNEEAEKKAAAEKQEKENELESGEKSGDEKQEGENKEKGGENNDNNKSKDVNKLTQEKALGAVSKEGVANVSNSGFSSGGGEGGGANNSSTFSGSSSPVRGRRITLRDDDDDDDEEIHLEGGAGSPTRDQLGMPSKSDYVVMETNEAINRLKAVGSGNFFQALLSQDLKEEKQEGGAGNNNNDNSTNNNNNKVTSGKFGQEGSLAEFLSLSPTASSPSGSPNTKKTNNNNNNNNNKNNENEEDPDEVFFRQLLQKSGSGQITVSRASGLVEGLNFSREPEVLSLNLEDASPSPIRKNENAGKEGEGGEGNNSDFDDLDEKAPKLPIQQKEIDEEDDQESGKEQEGEEEEKKKKDEKKRKNKKKKIVIDSDGDECEEYQEEIIEEQEEDEDDEMKLAADDAVAAIEGRAPSSQKLKKEPKKTMVTRRRKVKDIKSDEEEEDDDEDGEQVALGSDNSPANPFGKQHMPVQSALDRLDILGGGGAAAGGGGRGTNVVSSDHHSNSSAKKTLQSLELSGSSLSGAFSVPAPPIMNDAYTLSSPSSATVGVNAQTSNPFLQQIASFSPSAVGAASEQHVDPYSTKRPVNFAEFEVPAAPFAGGGVQPSASDSNFAAPMSSNSSGALQPLRNASRVDITPLSKSQSDSSFSNNNNNINSSSTAADIRPLFSGIFAPTPIDKERAKLESDLADSRRSVLSKSGSRPLFQVSASQIVRSALTSSGTKPSSPQKQQQNQNQYQQQQNPMQIQSPSSNGGVGGAFSPRASNNTPNPTTSSSSSSSSSASTKPSAPTMTSSRGSFASIEEL